MKLKDGSHSIITFKDYKPALEALMQELQFDNIKLYLLSDDSYDIFYITKINFMRTTELIHNELLDTLYETN
jgi:hypothetical protein